ncbi:2-keto-4-pentenoate hydratase [Rhodococcus sp. BE178]|uniref:2-keto-4-pentenoate hydratase n=1 Tax=Rhodococcus sp. BE178 TaxID=2817737 RepID=UPI003D1F6E8C
MLTLDDAYLVQGLVANLRIARGDFVTGAKLGFTSKAKALQMGVSDVIFGRLHASQAYEDGATVELDGFIHPRIEPELAFRLGRAFDAAGTEHPATDMVDAIDAVAPALEIIDSRYLDFRFSLSDVVADNTSAAGFVVGRWQPVDLVASPPALNGQPVTLDVDDETAAAGSTSDILGDPYLAIPNLARIAAEQGVALPAGSVLLAGAATAAVPLTPGTTVMATVASLGTVSITTSNTAGDHQ